ncbi:MAG: sulfite exporter TauE/SafE family protein [Desulfobacterales bacterium]|nr:MAG: sulfite exporter TauE/SafE family protein [Desulfobacterales bacterium]
MLTETISFPAAFIAGLLSFFSPCILPLIPGYFTFITGFSLEKLTQVENTEIRKKVVLSTLLFVLGFSFVFILMGASASYLGGLFYQYRKFIRITGGLLIIVLGVHLMGFIRIPVLDMEKRIHLDQKPLHFLGTFIIGMAFGAGWSPCIGPLLGSILIVAGSQETVWQGTVLLGVYSTGLAIPFIIMSVFINFVLVFIKKAVKTMKYINAVAGILLIVMGLFLVTNKLYVFVG